jgi:hypothetical protein
MMKALATVAITAIAADVVVAAITDLAGLSARAGMVRPTLRTTVRIPRHTLFWVMGVLVAKFFTATAASSPRSSIIESHK